MAGDQYNQTFYFCNFFVINSTFIQTSTVFILWFIYGIMKSMLLGTLNKAMGIKKVTDETGNSTASPPMEIPLPGQTQPLAATPPVPLVLLMEA